ncbi:MAG: integrase, partial [Rubrivivax sp.]
MPKPRADRGTSRLSPALQEAVLQAKRDNPQRSVRQILRVLHSAGLAARGELS